MRLLVLSVGRLNKGPERELIERYAVRIKPLARQLGFGTLEFHTLSESRKESAPIRMEEEALKLSKLIPTGALVALDERGKAVTSPTFAQDLQTLRDAGHEAITFLIGGPDGLDPSLRKKADSVLAFGAMTWPHQLTCAMLTEQIYRGLTLLSGHPYHRQ